MPNGQKINGPIPKHSSERRRRNKESKPESVAMAGGVKAPGVPRGAHPIARRWYMSLKASGQAQYFEPSDWQAALALVEQMTRLLADRAIVIGKGEEREVVYIKQPLTGPEFTSMWSAMNDLLTTEAARRRARLEVERVQPVATPEGITKIREFRKSVAQ